MIVFLDTIAPFAFSAAQVIKSERRTYFVAAPPARMLVVVRHGLILHQLAGVYVDANVGTEIGTNGFSLFPGKKQSKLTIYRTEPNHTNYDATTLSAILAKAYHEPHESAVYNVD